MDCDSASSCSHAALVEGTGVIGRPMFVFDMGIHSNAFVLSLIPSFLTLVPGSIVGAVPGGAHSYGRRNSDGGFGALERRGQG